jgi:hypothetical protein
MAVYEVDFGFAVFWHVHCAEQLFVNEKNSQIKKSPANAGLFNYTNLSTNYTKT